MVRIRSMWKRYGYIVFALAVGGVTGLLWMGSPADKEFRLLTLTFLGLAALGIVLEVFRLRRTAELRQPADDPSAASVSTLTPANADVDALLHAEQLLHPGTISLPLTIKPNPRNAVPLWIGLVASVGLAVEAVIVFHLSGTGILISGAVAGACAILVLSFRQRYFSGTSLFVDQQEAGLVSAFGRRKAVSSAAIRNIALRQVTYGKGAVKKLIVVGKDGRALLAINGEGFAVADAALFAAALRVPVSASWEPITASKLRHDIPGAVTPVYRYAMVSSIVLAIVLFIVILTLSPRPGH